MTPDPTFAGDSALLLELEPRIDPAVNARAISIADGVRRASIDGVRDVVSTYRSVAVHFHPLKTRVGTVTAAMTAASAEASPAVESRAPIEVPVVYGGRDGPDLGDVARLAGIPEADVIARHASTGSRVFMLGFIPGYPYMGTVPASIAMPRLPTPRTRVAAGSVGIAGEQTGIYPCETPGGWRIIGRTDLELFDETRERPALFAAGDTARFVPVDRVGPAKRRRPDLAAVPPAPRAVTVLVPAS